MLLIRNRFKNSLRILTILMTMSVLVACGNTEYQDLEQQVRRLKEKKPEPIPPLPSFRITQVYNYSADTLRSPFAQSAPRKGGSPNANRPKELLEAFSLDGLRMVGSLIEGNKRWAIIVAPNGMLYYATVGNYLGQNYGRVTKVDANKLELLETIQGSEGWLERTTSLSLAESE